MRSCGYTIFVAVIACAGAPAIAQRSLPPSVLPPSVLQPLDEGVADLSENGVSLRHMQADLRSEFDFDHVYSSPTHPDMLMRRSGAITALFPQSHYVRTKTGEIAAIPAGTVFFIGDPALPSAPASPEESAPQSTRLSAPRSGHIDGRIFGTVAARPEARAPRPVTTEGPARPDVALERYRQARLREIAARHARGAS